MRPAADREQTNLDDRLLQGVRARLAVSHFKRAVLGDLHLGDRAQSKTLFEALEDLALERAPKALVGSPSFDPLRWLGFELAHFSDRGRLFQADRGRRFRAIVDARGLRASEVFNVSQSSTISLKRGVDAPLSVRPQGAY